MIRQVPPYIVIADDESGVPVRYWNSHTKCREILSGSRYLLVVSECLTLVVTSSLWPLSIRLELLWLISIKNARSIVFNAGIPYWISKLAKVGINSSRDFTTVIIIIRCDFKMLIASGSGLIFEQIDGVAYYYIVSVAKVRVLWDAKRRARIRIISYLMMMILILTWQK